MSQLYFRDTGLLNNTSSGITNFHPHFHNESTFRICSTIGQISITWPSNQPIHNDSQATGKFDVGIICGSDKVATSPVSIATPYRQEILFLVADQMSISLMLQWLIGDEMMCHQYQTTMAARDMQSHIGDMQINPYF